MENTPIPILSDREKLVHEGIGAVIRAEHRHHRLIDQQVDSLGIHRSQHQMLMTLFRMGRTASQKAIADKLGISPAAVARTLKRLEAEGYIEKLSGADSRRNEIVILPAGQAKIEATHSLFLTLDQAVFRDIPDDDIAVMTATLRRMLENMARLEAAEPPKGGEKPL